jgi:hypothetical protein
VPEVSSIPLGSWPQWLLLVVVVMGFAKWLFPWRADEMRKLRAELKACELDCDRRLKKLEADLWGEKRQRVTEQISFINVILQSVDAPELKTMLKSLESVQAQIRVQHIIESEGK